MRPARTLFTAVVAAGLVAGCTTQPARSTPSTSPEASPATTRTTGRGSVTTGRAAPPIAEARREALWWVASTGELLAMGPIARHDLLTGRVASASLAAMSANLDTDLDRLAGGLPVPAAELRLVETPITINVTLTADGDEADAHVWSVAVFGAAALGAPRVVFRTSHLHLVVDADRWRLASFTSTEGPTPLAGDTLPASWDDFAAVTAWTAATRGVG